MIIGDFNALLSTHDKIRGMLVTHYELQDLETMLQSCNSVALELVGII